MFFFNFKLFFIFIFTIFLFINNLYSYPKKSDDENKSKDIDSIDSTNSKNSKNLITREKDSSFQTNFNDKNKSNTTPSTQTLNSATKILDSIGITNEKILNQDNSEEEKNVQVLISLGDGRSFKGTAKFKLPNKIKSEHFKNGIRYKKEFSIQDVDYIEYLNWKPKYYKSNSHGDIFSFEVSRFVIYLKNGQSLMQMGPLFSFLREFNVTNEYGEVMVYSYWLDLYQKDATWSTGLIGTLGSERSSPLSEVLKKISFRYGD